MSLPLGTELELVTRSSVEWDTGEGAVGYQAVFGGVSSSTGDLRVDATSSVQ